MRGLKRENKSVRSWHREKKRGRNKIRVGGSGIGVATHPAKTQLSAQFRTTPNLRYQQSWLAHSSSTTDCFSRRYKRDLQYKKAHLKALFKKRERYQSGRYSVIHRIRKMSRRSTLIQKSALEGGNTMTSQQNQSHTSSSKETMYCRPTLLPN